MSGILGWKPRTCEYIWKQTWQRRLYQFQACSDKQPRRWYVFLLLLNIPSFNLIQIVNWHFLLHDLSIRIVFLNSDLRPFRSDSSGLLTAVHKDYFRVVNYRELLFNDCGDRVAQLLHVELAVPFSHCRNNDIRQEILIVNTHLLFPHDSSLCLVRLNQVGALMAFCIYATSCTFQFQRFLNLFFQVYKILQYVESYQKENKLNPMPIILCG